MLRYRPSFKVAFPVRGDTRCGRCLRDEHSQCYRSFATEVPTPRNAIRFRIYRPGHKHHLRAREEHSSKAAQLEVSGEYMLRAICRFQPQPPTAYGASILRATRPTSDSSSRTARSYIQDAPIQMHTAVEATSNPSPDIRDTSHDGVMKVLQIDGPLHGGRSSGVSRPPHSMPSPRAH